MVTASSTRVQQARCTSCLFSIHRRSRRQCTTCRVLGRTTRVVRRRPVVAGFLRTSSPCELTCSTSIRSIRSPRRDRSTRSPSPRRTCRHRRQGQGQGQGSRCSVRHLIQCRVAVREASHRPRRATTMATRARRGGKQLRGQCVRGRPCHPRRALCGLR